MTIYDKPIFLPAGDRAFTVELGCTISPVLNRRIHNLLRAVESSEPDGVVDLIPTYRSLLIEYDPLQASLHDLQRLIMELESDLDESTPSGSKIVYLPTIYGGEYGPDLEEVAKHTSLNVDEVVHIHSEIEYLVYMMGFTPGFPYLGGMAQSLALPRLNTPRSSIPAGSVGIAENQTGIYPTESPGGWRLIGRTPVPLFQPLHDPPCPLEPGDYVKFVPLTGNEEYSQIKKQVSSGEYVIKISYRE